MMTYRKRSAFSRARQKPIDRPVLNATDDPYLEVWRIIEDRYKKSALAGVPASCRREIECEIEGFLAEMYPVYTSAVDRIESNPLMRFPLLSQLVIGDTSTRGGMERLAIEITDLLEHSRCFWLRPLSDREKIIFGERGKAAYSARLYRLASELNARSEGIGSL